MPIFECDKCKMVDNTATSNYWMRNPDDPKLCSFCDEGMWHGLFARHTAKELNLVPGPDGFLRDK